VIVLDTHVLIWWLADPRKLSAAAARAIKRAAGAGEVAVSSISVFEISTLVRRGRLRLTTDLDRWMKAVRSLPELVIEPVSAEIALTAGSFDSSSPGDPADRIIAATARVLNARLLSADDKLRTAAAVEVVW